MPNVKGIKKWFEESCFGEPEKIRTITNNEKGKINKFTIRGWTGYTLSTDDEKKIITEEDEKRD